MAKKTTYVFLGELSPGELRLAKSNHGDYYLFDRSGGDPESTDDGPCRMRLDSAMLVDLRGVLIRVVRERDGSQCASRTTHEGALRLRNLLINSAPLEPTRPYLPRVKVDNTDRVALTAIFDLLNLEHEGT